MKLRLHARRSFQYQSRDRWAAAFCHHLDRAVSPIGTASLILGLFAAALDISSAANYLMATGLLFHLAVWFAGWLESVTRQ
jgi:hypothetical protein